MPVRIFGPAFFDGKKGKISAHHELILYRWRMDNEGQKSRAGRSGIAVGGDHMGWWIYCREDGSGKLCCYGGVGLAVSRSSCADGDIFS